MCGRNPADCPDASRLEMKQTPSCTGCRRPLRRAGRAARDAPPGLADPVARSPALCRRVRPSPGRHHWPMPPPSGYELIDFGGGARLERFGDRVVDRPYPGALGARTQPEAWQTADLRYDRDRGWSGPSVPAGAWPCDADGLRLELRATDAGQVGLFPEHLGMLAWLRARVAQRATAGPAPAVLHLFAYTGLATLAMAEAGAEVTHVDASRPTVGWARRNAELSGLSDSPDPLDRRRRAGLHRARGAPRSPVRRDRARPTELRARTRGPSVAPGGGPGTSAGGLRSGARAGWVRAPDGAHARVRRRPPARLVGGRSPIDPRGDIEGGDLAVRDRRTAASSSSAPSRDRPAGHDVADALPCPADPDQPGQPEDQGRGGPP